MIGPPYDGLMSYSRIRRFEKLLGLTLLFGWIAAWDVRRIGVVKEVPIVAFHRLVPFAILGFAINAASGFMFLVTYPDQYVYNPAFHLKVLCLILAGLNVMVFYLTSFRRIESLGAGQQPPLSGRLAGALSLALWITVIICGRMITFFRPAVCAASDAAGFVAECIVR